MRGEDFVGRRLPENEEPDNWVVCKFGDLTNRLYLISKYGWSFLYEGKPNDRAIWLQDRYGYKFPFAISDWRPDKQDLHSILSFVSTFESVNNYQQQYRAEQVACALRDRRTPRSSRIAKAAKILEAPIGELFKNSSNPGITREILEAGASN
jgi:hypothetical protein